MLVNPAESGNRIQTSNCLSRFSRKFAIHRSNTCTDQGTSSRLHSHCLSVGLPQDLFMMSTGALQEIEGSTATGPSRLGCQSSGNRDPLKPLTTFFSLPPELRDIIYEDALYNPNGIKCPRVPKGRRHDTVPAKLYECSLFPKQMLPNLLYATLQVRREALPLLFKVNTILLVDQRPNYVDLITQMSSILDKAQAWNMVQSLKYWFTRSEGTVDAMVEFLSALPNLKEVTVVFSAFSCGPLMAPERFVSCKCIDTLIELPNLRHIVLDKLDKNSCYMDFTERVMRAFKSTAERRSKGRITVDIIVGEGPSYSYLL
ncbi:hypothetical protein BT63DRAFT_301782 [Microthyrium microscopicum]|uniref:F-box domain-containing protein n=1 Tax=Microthyrium microscopicum TaxID=703497 RepID=A0A6A6U795_9PEZI|nr:hypothetical protein BT63DRAFT_301782 [Microthyrium microscopicum]